MASVIAGLLGSIGLTTLLVGLITAGLLVYGFLSLLPGPKTPPVLSGLPIAGSAFRFIKGPLPLIEEGYKKLGEIFTVKAFHKRMTFVVGPEAQELFFGGTDQQLDQAEVYKFNIPVFGPGVVYDVDLPTRNEQFKHVAALMKPALLKTYVDQMVQEAEDFFSTWGEEGIVDLRDKFSELIILTASRCLMGREVREHLVGEIARIYHDLDDGMQPISVFLPYAPIEAHRKRDKARLDMVKLFTKVLNERRSNPALYSQDDFLGGLMKFRYRNGEAMGDEQIAGMMIALLFAGQHTSSITASWTALCVYNKAEKLIPELLEEQQQVRDESCPDGELNYEALNNMWKLHNCIKEALRMYPPLIMLMRYVQEPLQYKDYTVPKGDILVVSPPVSHRVEEVFKNPDVYDPDRFAEPRVEDKKGGAYSYVAFGGGRHTCLGKGFGYLQVKAIMSVVLKNFEFELLDGCPEPDYNAMIVGPLPSKVKFRRVKRDF